MLYFPERSFFRENVLQNCQENLDQKDQRNIISGFKRVLLIPDKTNRQNSDIQNIIFGNHQNNLVNNI